MPKGDIPVIKPYNPLDKRNLGASVAATMLATPTHTLPPDPFIGAGVYAIYYRGDFAPYQRLAALNKDAFDARFISVKLFLPVQERAAWGQT